MPTPRQRLVAKKILENKGMAVSRAMIEAGYPKTTAKNPQQLTESKSWKELLAEYLPDKLLIEKNEEGLNATKKEDRKKVPDYYIRHRYLETALKIKGKLTESYGDGKAGISVNVIQFGYIPRPVEVTASSVGSDEKPVEIQDAHLAPAGEKDDNSTDGIG